MRHPLAYFILSLCFFSTCSHAQDWVSSLSVYGVPLSCTSSTGKPVPLKATDDAIAKGGGGYAEIDPIKGPSILLSPTYLTKLPRVGAFFLFFHECAHIALPIGVGLLSESQEGNADCYAIKEMRKVGMIYSWATFSEAVTVIRNLPGSSRGHLPGPERVAAAANCAGIPVISNSNALCHAIDRVFAGGIRNLALTQNSGKSVVAGFSCEALDEGKRLYCRRDYGDVEKKNSDAASIRGELKQCMPPEFKYFPPASGFFAWKNIDTGQSVGVSAHDDEEISFDITP